MPLLTRCLVAAVLAVAVAVTGPAAAQAPDPLRDRQWHLDAVSADEAWEATRGERVTVAVIDTGVDADHPDLDGRVLTGYDAVDRGTPPDDENGHGTLVAGVIGAIADNGEGGAGIAPRAQILPVRVLDADGRGRPSEVADGIRWAVRRDADVINLSLVEVPGAADGLLDGVGLIDRDVEDAIRDAAEAGVVVVGAAGNDGDDEVPYARDLPVTVVGAADRDGRRWSRSNADEDTLFAPGVDIVSTWSERRYATANGTSFAAPIVAAGAALLVDLGLDADQVATVLRQQTRPTSSDPRAVDVVDLAAAIDAAADLDANDVAPRDPGGVDGRTQRAASDDEPEPTGEDHGGTSGDGEDGRDGRGGGAAGDAARGPGSAPADIAEVDETELRPAPRGGEGGDARPDGGEVAANTGAGDGRPSPGPVVIAWTLLGGVLAGHVVAARSWLFE